MGSIGSGLTLRAIGSHCAPAATGGYGMIRQHPDFLSGAKSLLMPEFRVAISVTIGFWPFDCAFRDLET
jgi:hypothetical protein